MALQTSGQISIADINTELGNSSTAQLGLGDTAARDLAGIASGQISLNDFYGVSAGGTWDITTASYVQSLAIGNQDAAPSGIHFKPDGTKMYMVGYAKDRVNEFNLSTPWDISSASISSTFYVGHQDGSPGGVFFKPDGTKMFVGGSRGGDVLTYELQTPWRVNTAYYSSSFILSNFDPHSVFFSDDGTKMFVNNWEDDEIRRYNLNSAWDLSSASFSAAFYPNQTVSGVFFKPDGTKMYTVNRSTDNIVEFDLSTPWDIENASYLRQKNFTNEDSSMYNMFIREDGFKMYLVGQGSDRVYEYDLS